jgi:PPOX class probable F420-dependent enzyme
VTTIPATVRAVIESGRLGHLVTLNADGSPQVTCVWVGIQDDALVTAHLRDQQKLRNVRRDPRVALSFDAEGTNAIGMQHCLLVYGRAPVTGVALRRYSSAWPRPISGQGRSSHQWTSRRLATCW